MTDEPNLCLIPEYISLLLSFFLHQIYAFYKADFFLLKKDAGEQFGSDLNPLSLFFWGTMNI